MREVAALDAVVDAPAWAARLVDRRARVELTGLLRAYADAALTPYGDTVAARIEAQRGLHLRQLRDAGAGGMLEDLGPVLRWEEPVLHAAGYPVDRDVHLDGLGSCAPRPRGQPRANSPVPSGSPRRPPAGMPGCCARPGCCAAAGARRWCCTP